MGYLIDTNIVIYYFNGLTDDETLHVRFAESFNVSIITKIEFLGWGKFSEDRKLYAQARDFMRYARIIGLTETIAEQAISLRQQFKSKTPDTIIAATALVNGLTVITNNTLDFTRLGVDTISVRLK